MKKLKDGYIKLAEVKDAGYELSDELMEIAEATDRLGLEVMADTRICTGIDSNIITGIRVQLGSRPLPLWLDLSSFGENQWCTSKED